MGEAHKSNSDHSTARTDESSTWQPIETAPTGPFDYDRWFMPHSPRLLLWVGEYAVIGTYNFTERGKGRWQGPLGNISPTHWMPLPAPPSKGVDTGRHGQDKSGCSGSVGCSESGGTHD
ncbi:DUF551 domain-containing protein [Ramlibacter sp. AN1015]|uniref:DUF551 domain-containing protein n=1 Tax=Ramlibacter sp. AN1015 TaxID=3133428 RepID=UPI0040409D22